jgi:hypothetical protein
MTHALKTWPTFFKDVESGLKSFEIRKADRNFQLGDTLLLQEFDPEKKSYTGQEWQGHITYVFTDEAFGLKKGYVLLGIKEKEN